MTKTYEINGTQFPYADAQYPDTDNRVTGKHFYHNLRIEPLPVIRKNMLESQGVISVESMARTQMLTEDPHVFDTNFYGNYKAGTWARLRKQTVKTMYWIMNKQPASFTLYIDSFTKDVTDHIKMLMQNGVKVNISIPATGYVCTIPPVFNKKQHPLFTKVFICEQYVKQFEAGQMTDPNLLNALDAIYAKAAMLQDYRAELQQKIWDNVNYVLNDFTDEWKCQNIYTMQDKKAYAINEQTKDVLLKYNTDFKRTQASAYTLADLQNPEFFEKMLRIVDTYKSAFGIEVKTSTSQADTMTYMPEHWMRINELRRYSKQEKYAPSTLLKQTLKVQQSMSASELYDLFNAYAQIDFYMNQPEPTEFMLPEYFLCKCGQPLYIPTEYSTYMSIDGEVYDADAWTNAEGLLPVVICPKCGEVHFPEGAPDYNEI